MNPKSAIVPYRHVDGKIEVLLIRNNTNTKWIIPKGTIEVPLASHISATNEAYEEAGVLGTTHPIIIGKYYRNNQWIPAYILEVNLELKDYEEQGKRNRQWINPDEIETYVSDINLIELIEIGIKCIQKNSYYFKYAIQTFCYQNQYELLSINKKEARIKIFEQTLIKEVLIARRKSTLEFSIPSTISYANLSEVPGPLASRLLLENADNSIGFWCLQNIENQLKVACMHNEELKLLNSVFFKKIIGLLADKCASFEKEYLK